MRIARLLLLAGILGSALASLAQGNLIVNGGFEQGETGWNPNGTYGWNDDARFAYEGRAVGVVIDRPHSTFGIMMEQTLNTLPGAAYYIRFALLSGEGTVGSVPYNASPVIISWADQQLGGVANRDTRNWQTYQFQVTAPSVRTVISFESAGNSWQYIDAISVVPVPEPSIFQLASAAALAILFKRRHSPQATRTP